MGSITNIHPLRAVAQENTDTADTARRLAELEEIVERGKQGFLEVATALAEIHECKLYREAGFTTFEDYVSKRWGWTRRNAYHYLQAAEVVQNVKSISQGDSTPSLTQAVALASLQPEEQ